ncbi:MAG: methylenetetrahydrofolate reductase [NAD(P)H] [Oscillospiraceae bacterium]|nr:methylenetetrahydrofolate reductase [NAD(P)H] [Oscillospiraceae bacterium]
MKISEIYTEKAKISRTVFAIEVFPPKKNASADKVYAALEEIAGLKPDYISVTCGAGGSDSGGGNPTLEVSSFIKNSCGVEPMAHLTCVASTRQNVIDTLNALKQNNIGNVLALRGDINPEVTRENDFEYASDLTSFIRTSEEYRNFGITGACYPEGHVESETANADLKNLKKKVDSGCDTLITQLFFENTLFYSFMEKVRLIGIDIPVSAGIMPVTSKKQIERMVSMCGASLPAKFTKMLARYENRPEALRDAGIAYATEQIVDLISNGVEGIHLYAMNSAYIARKVLENVGKLL